MNKFKYKVRGEPGIVQRRELSQYDISPSVRLQLQKLNITGMPIVHIFCIWSLALHINHYTLTHTFNCRLYDEAGYPKIPGLNLYLPDIFWEGLHFYFAFPRSILTRPSPLRRRQCCQQKGDEQR